MPPRLVQFCRDLLGSGVVLSLVVVPLFFSVSLIEPFEAAKAALLQGLASLLLPVLCVALVAGWGQIRAHLFGPAPWLLWLLLAYLAVVALSTATSVSPLFSLWGSPARSHGALTVAAFAVVFVSAVVGDHRETGVRRASLAVTLASLPVTLYALLQWRGQDPLPFQKGPLIPSFLGNPNWIGAWLIMAVPVTCALLVLVPSPAAFAVSRGMRRGLGGLLALLLLLQLFAVLRLTGRGAVLGLGVGLFFFLLFLGTLTRRRSIVYVLGGLLAVGMLAVVGVLLLARMALPFPGDALSLESIVTRTGLQRVLIGESVLRLMAGTPARLLTGYGLDTLGLVVGVAYPTHQAALDLLAVVIWDRAHTLFLDVFAALGVGGALLFLGIVGAVVFRGLKALGIAPTASARWWLGVAVGAALYAMVVGFLAGRTVFALLGLSGGLLGGLGLYLAARTYSLNRGDPPVPLAALAPRQVLLAGLLSAILAHFAELQFGFQIMSSELTFWVYAGLVAGMAWTRTEDGAVGEPPRRRRAARDLKAHLAEIRGSPVSEGLLLGVALASMIVSLLVPDLPVINWRILGLLGMTWVLGSVLLALADPSGSTGGREWKRVAVVAGVSLLWGGLFLAAWVLTRDRPLTLGPVPYFLFVAATLVALTVAVKGPGKAESVARPVRRGSGTAGWLSLGGAVAVGLYLGYEVAVVPLLASAAALQGRASLEREDLAQGIPLLRQAVELAPWRDYYAELLAGAYWERARRSDPERWLQQSEALLLRALEQNPRDPSHAVNLSTLNALWAELVPSTQSERLAESRRYAFHALRLDPIRSRPRVEERLQSILVQQGTAPEIARGEAKRLVGGSP